MEELLTKLNSDFDEIEGWILIVDADWHSDDLRLSLSISMNSESTPELWEVSCIGVIEESICSVGEERLTIQSESPLLFPYTELQNDIFFSENNCEPATLLGLIFSSCVEIFGKSEYLDRYLNQKPTSSGIVSSKFGKLGRFPKPLANEIMRVLKTQPIQVNSIETGPPKHWTGSKYIPYPKLLVLDMGSSYVIGEQFSAARA